MPISVNHPNAGGVLVLGLGCENNNIDVFKSVLGTWDEDRVKFLNTQDFDDEIAEGIRLIDELKVNAKKTTRQLISVSELKIGLKCGGSDGFSGITANPLVGRLSDKLISYGGSCVLTEVPEMFGAEHLLMQRCESKEIFDKTVALINNFKDYYTRHNQVIYENPSPGNKKTEFKITSEQILNAQKECTAIINELKGQKWEFDETREEMILCAESICVLSQLGGKMKGIQTNNVIKPKEWLKKFSSKWLEKNKQSELEKIEEMILFIDAYQTR